MANKIPNLRFVKGVIVAESGLSAEDVEQFRTELHNMPLLTSQNVTNSGLKSRAEGDWNERENTYHLDLMYVSAMPSMAFAKENYDSLFNHRNEPTSADHEALYNKLIELYLYQQFLLVFYGAVDRSPCDLYLLPVGAGEFKNDLSIVWRAMVLAYDSVSKKTEMIEQVTVYIVTSNSEKEYFVGQQRLQLLKECRQAS